MSPENNFADGLGDIFDEAFDSSETNLSESLKNTEDVYSDFKFYSEGGLKRIDLCYNRKTNRRVAMATLKDGSDPQKVEVFLREAKLNAALQHPNIVPVYNIGLDQDKPWFTMKFIAGQSLSEVIDELKSGKQNEFSGLNNRLDIFLKVCDAIAYAHSVGVVHLDIKPDNIRISSYGDVVLCDWGLADVEASCCDELLLEYCSVLDHDIENHTIHGTVKGSPGYMAPEQTSKLKMRKGFHTDIFSLGTLLYALLSLEKPFKGKSIDEILDKTARCQFPIPTSLNSQIPISLEAVCLKAMALQPEDRYANVQDLQKDILAYRNGFMPDAEEASFAKALKLLLLRHKAFSTLAIFTLLILATALLALSNNLKLAKENEVQLKEKLKLEQEFNKQMGVDAAPLFLERAIDAFDICKFDESLRFADNAVNRNPNLQKAWRVKANNHFIREEYQAFLKVHEKAAYSSTHPMTKLALKYSQIKADDSTALNISQYLNLLTDFKPLNNGHIYFKIIHYKAFQNLDIDDRIKFCKGVITLNHGPKKAALLNFYFNKSTGHLDVSNNLWLSSHLCLMNFPAKSIDLSNTAIYNSIGLRAMPLEAADLSNTKIIELQTFPSKKVKVLKLSGNTLFHIKPITDLPIEELHIQHTLIVNSQEIALLTKLKKLHLHEGQFSKREMAQIPSNIEIIIHKKPQ
ncbi:serine/threonine-protein kinase [Lentisphaera marina]|uniref:serine/threonine protein kinase n=1 Tax=Lentisphaera marina TaxID=1111041 RepID=UPI002366F14D|nr:serine/threonine-protein kinase [Lentisphaera marina]MDD7983877.1 serine/threonine-protein kinase [Lentisphaera marina]